ncbi:MAG: BREX system Lon protease-like protein BrxL [Promethearchaeota archaeon]
MLQKLPNLDKIDEIAKSQYSGNIVRKIYARAIPNLKNLPVYVSEYLISKYLDDNGILQEDALEEIQRLSLSTYEKCEKEAIKSMIMEVGVVKLVDFYEAYTDLRKGRYYSYIPKLDEKATVNRDLLKPHKFQALLKGGLWGKAKIEYLRNRESVSLNICEFEPLQSFNAITKTYIRGRYAFSTNEWIDFLIRTIGINPNSISRKLKFMYLARLIPFVETCCNLMELGPPGTGKSFIFENISQYSRILVGGEITPAKLIYNQQTKANGLIFYKDVICFDEIDQSNPKLKEIMPKLQQIMASNRVERGEMEATTIISLVFQGNPEFEVFNGKYQPKGGDCIKALPDYMRNTAFLDRIHIFLHGWEFPRYSNNHINYNLGLVNNYFGQILHKLRKISVEDVIYKNIEFYAIDDTGKSIPISLRDKTALYTTLSGYIKLIFPHKKINKSELKEIVEISIKLRQNIIEEMKKIDPKLYREIKYSFIEEKEEAEGRECDIEVREKRNTDVSEISTSLISPMEMKQPEFKGFQLNLLNIFVDDKDFIVKKIPYFLLKILKDFNNIYIKDSKYKLKNKGNIPFSIIIVNNDALKPINIGSNIGLGNVAEKGSTNNLYNRNYSDEENNLVAINNKLKELMQNLEIFEENRDKLYYIKGNSSILEDTHENDQYFKKLNEFEKNLLDIDNYKIKKLKKEVKMVKDYLERAASYQPDLLSSNYDPIILDSKEVIKIINNFIDKISNENQKYNDIQEILNILQKKISENLEKEYKLKLPFKGEKFAFYAVDLNNIIYSYRDKFPNVRKFNPFTKIKRYLRKEQNYIIYLFATKQLEYLKRSTTDIENSEWFIEEMVKNKITGKYVDIDSLLLTECTSFINKYYKYIKHFYLVSGDKDFHTLITLAKRNNIPTSIIAVDQRFVSQELIDLVDNVYFFN